MVKPFLPGLPETARREGRTITQYVLSLKGHKAFQKLTEDTSHYGTILQDLD
jgi:hypothetical protein